MPAAWCAPYSSCRRPKCPNLVVTPARILRLKELATSFGPRGRGLTRFPSLSISYLMFWLFLLGLMVATAFLAFDMVDNVKEMLTPSPVRAN